VPNGASSTSVAESIAAAPRIERTLRPERLDICIFKQSFTFCRFSQNAVEESGAIQPVR
jgi:hypothetical protein